MKRPEEIKIINKLKVLETPQYNKPNKINQGDSESTKVWPQRVPVCSVNRSYPMDNGGSPPSLKDRVPLLLTKYST